jgi:hypothetical protein
MPFAVLLYVFFTFLSVVGAFLAVDHHQGRAAAVWTAVGVLVFYIALAIGIFLLLRSGGFA